MEARHSSISLWMPKEMRRSYGTGLWKAILKGKDKFWKFIQFSLGFNEIIRFWDDVWCEDDPLKVEFGAIYNLVKDNKGMVRANSDPFVGGGDVGTQG